MTMKARSQKEHESMKRYDVTDILDGMYPDPEGAFVYYDDAHAEATRLHELLDSTTAQLHATQEERDKLQQTMQTVGFWQSTECKHWKAAIKKFARLTVAEFKSTRRGGWSDIHNSAAMKAALDGDLNALEKALGIEEKDKP